MNIDALPVPPSRLGESPFWWPEQAALYWCDIAGRTLNSWTPADGRHDAWSFDADVGCAAPVPNGEVLLALRTGLVRFDPRTGARRRLAQAPYDVDRQRFNDGKADPQGRFWVGTLCEPREPARASLYRWSERLERITGSISVSNGLAWSVDGRTMYWTDTHAHRIYAFDFDGTDGTLSRQRVFAAFQPKRPDGDLAGYGGRPDGAAVDAEGCYWVAMYEGQRLLRLAPDGRAVGEVRLPVRCPTMPCFGGHDLRTLYVTSARNGRPEAELAAQPLAGRVLMLRVDVPGLPTNFACG